jgi:sugar (pentulose or hexulose) kinase
VSDELLLGLDVGTTAVKAAVITADGEEVAHARARTPWRRVPTGAELDPDELLDSAVEAAANALAAGPDGRVAGIGVASMAETGVLLDRNGRPVVPAIAWHDTRGAAEAERLRADLGGEEYAARTGLPVRPMCTLVKYRWMRSHRPESAAGVRWLNIAEWLVRGLGGDEAAELSLACRTGGYDLHARVPWAAALDWAGAPPDLFPTAVIAGTPLGTADHPGLDGARGAVLAVGGHDHLSAAVGAGAAGDGDVLDSCGTAEALVRATAPLAPDAVARSVAGGITVGWHAVEGRQALQGAVWSGSALQRVLDLLGVPVEDRSELEAAAREADPAGLRLRGLDDEDLTLAGIGRDASPAAVYRAALEAVSAAAAAVLARMENVAGGPHRRLVVTGGWAEGDAARAVKARHLGPFEHSTAIFAGARGAALAAGRAAGLRSVGRDPALGVQDAIYKSSC